MNEVTTIADAINISYDENGNPTVSGRELHRALEVKTAYKDWFPRMCEYGFTEGTDFTTVLKNVRRADGAIMPQMQAEHDLTIQMAKELCMIQRTQKGKECRQFFLRIEEQWNSPDAVMARALKLADLKLIEAQKNIKRLEARIADERPKVIFAEAVSASKNTILIGDLAKLLKQNGVKTGQRRLFEWMRKSGYLMKKGTSYNLPTQRSMEMGLFEIKETAIPHADGHITVNKTVKVTGKGQQYFIHLLLEKKETSHDT